MPAIALTLDQLAGGALLVDNNGRITAVNATAARMFGGKRSELRGRAISELIPQWGELQGEFDQPPQRRSRRMESEARRPNGTRFPLRFTQSRVEMDGGSAIVVYVGDSTRRKIMEAKVQEARHGFHQIARALPHMLWTCLPDGMANYFSPQWLELTGATFESQLGEGWLGQLHPDDRTAVRESWQAAAARGETFRAEFRVRTHQGEYRWFDSTCAPVRSREGVLVRWLGSNVDVHDARETRQALIEERDRIIRDVAERKRAEEELRHSQARLQAAVRAGGIGTWIWDVQQNRVWWDEGMYALWGCRRQETFLLAGAITEFIHPEDRQRAMAGFDAFVRGRGEDFTMEHRIVRPDKSMIWIALSGRVERDANGAAVRMIGACMDVTARKQAEESQRQSQKIEALGTLAGGIAHDFNNILLAITGNAKLAMADLPYEHPIRRNLVEIDKASTRATNLVHRILAFGRQSEPKREVIQLRPTIEEALKLLRATLPAMIEIRSQFADDVPAVRADSTQIHQVIMNLITNSAHAIGNESGVVSVSLDTVTVEPRDVLAAKLKPGTYARVCVSDTGSGMDRSTLDRIFDPFFTTKPAGQGTGLGLSVVHGIMRNHEGEITVESAVGQGTTFHLYFPAARQEIEGAQAAPREASRGQGQHVLYVDDEDSLVYLATRVLQRLGYQVSGFTDPGQALRAFQEHPTNFDVVVTDVSMPGMSGFHLARAMLEIRPDLPVLMTSGYVRPQDREAAQAIGVRDLILKPNTIEELGHALERVFKSWEDESSPPP